MVVNGPFLLFVVVTLLVGEAALAKLMKTKGYVRQYLPNPPLMFRSSPPVTSSPCFRCLRRTSSFCVYLNLPRVRQRVGRILLQLWAHPLGDSRKAILELVRASMSATTADGGAIGGSSTGAATVLPQNLLARDFFTAAFDVITMFFNSGMEHLRDGAIEESANDGRPLQPGHPHWQKYSNERKSCKSSLDSM